MSGFRRWKDKLLSQMDKGKLLKYSGSYFVLFVAMGSMVFFGICDPGGRRRGGGLTSGGLSGAAATVAGETVSDMEFRRAYQELHARYQQQFADNFDPAAFELSKMVLGQLVDQRVIAAQAKGAGVYVTDKEIEKIIGDAEVFKDDKGKFSGERFDLYLRRNQYNEASFAEEMRRNLASEKFRRLIQETYYVPQAAAEWNWRLSETKYDIEFLKFDPAKVVVNITEDDLKTFLSGEGSKGKEKVKDYYDKNKSEFNTKQKIKARHVLLAFDSARNASPEAKKKSKEEAKKTADRVQAEAAKPDADFAKLAMQYTDDPSGKTSGGDLGTFEREAMVKEFSAAAFAMKEGEVSQVVESPFGFHVIKVERIMAATSTSLEEATPAVARKLLERERKPHMLDENATKVLEAVKANDPKAAELIQGMGLQWQATGEFAADARSIPVLGSDQPVREAVIALSQEKRVHPAVLDLGGTKYIVRLKNVVKADATKLTPDKREELADGAVFMEAYGLFNTLRAEAKKTYEKDGKIWLNPEFLNLDKQRKADRTQDADEEGT